MDQVAEKTIEERLDDAIDDVVPDLIYGRKGLIVEVEKPKDPIHLSDKVVFTLRLHGEERVIDSNTVNCLINYNRYMIYNSLSSIVVNMANNSCSNDQVTEKRDSNDDVVSALMSKSCSNCLHGVDYGDVKRIVCRRYPKITSKCSSEFCGEWSAR